MVSAIILMTTLLAPSDVVAQGNSDSESARQYNAIANNSNNIDTIKKFAKMAYDIALKANDVPALIDCTNNLAYVYGAEFKYDTAIMYYNRLRKLILDDASRKNDLARTYVNLAVCYKKTGKILDMWEVFRKSRDLFAELNDTSKICWADLELGESNERLGMYEQARVYYNSVLALAKETGNRDYIVAANYVIGRSILYEHFDDRSDSAAIYLQESLRKIMFANGVQLKDFDLNFSIRSQLPFTLAKCYLALLNVDERRDDYIDSCHKYLDVYRESNACFAIEDSIAMETMSTSLMMTEGKYKEAVPLLTEMTKIPVKDNYTREIAEVYRQLSQCYAALGNVKEAYFAKKWYNELSNAASNEENVKRTADFTARIEIDKDREEKLKADQNREYAALIERVERASTLKKTVAGLVVATIVALIIVFSLRKKHRLSRELSDRNDQLLAQRDIIERQKNDEQEAQSIILSSVEFASKIQSQAIGSVESVTAVFPENFVYYRPRNIVSGDWYMATMLRRHKIMIEADCTGHGIPGALLCMLGVSALKDIFNRLRHTSSEIMPGHILDEMRIAIKNAINKNNGDSKSVIDDGMDMTIIIIPPSGDQLLFGGACQSAMLVSGGEVKRLKGDANPIGNYVREIQHFATLTVPVTPDDAVYLCSDGIQDQIGGPEDRKYSFKRLMDFLADHYALPMQEQLSLFEAELDAYAGDSAQVDDRTLIGIRIGGK